MTMTSEASDRRAVWIGLATATIMIGQFVAAKASGDTLFLSHYDVTELPRVVIASALLSIIGVASASKLLARSGPSVVVPIAFAASSVAFLAEWLYYPTSPRLVAVVVYVHVSTLGPILISGFWSTLNERFDPHSAKPIIARTAAAATLGGVFGGLTADLVATAFDLRTMLLVLAAGHALCVAGVAGLGSGSNAALPEQSGPAYSGFALIRRHWYLRRMAMLLVLVSAVAALVDYAFKAKASILFTSPDALIGFFAAFYAVAGVVSFAVQSVLGPRVLRRYGIGPALAVLPVAIILGGLLGASVTRIWTLVLVRGAQTVLYNSLFRSAFELLYTPLPPEHKRPTKTIIDVAAARFGDALGALVILSLLAIWHGLPLSVVLGLAAALSGAILHVVERLHRGYVAELAQGLNRGAVTLPDDQIIDATTQHILAETSAYTEREQLMRRINEHRTTHGAGNGLADGHGSDAVGLSRASDLWSDTDSLEAEALGISKPVRPSPPIDDRLSAVTAQLVSGDTDLMRQALHGDYMDTRLVPHLIPLLAHPELAQDARMELRWLVPRIIGQLTDGLLDPDIPLLARQRIPGVLEASHNPRSVAGLLDGILDESFNVRYSSARALARMRSRDHELRMPRTTIYAAVKREVGVEAKEWANRTLTTSSPASLLQAGEDGSPEPHSRSIEHVFTLLGLVHDPRAIQLSLQAVQSADRQLRGTALEYLETVLPLEMWRALWPRLGAVPRAEGRRRPSREIVKDLLDSADAIESKAPGPDTPIG